MPQCASAIRAWRGLDTEGAKSGTRAEESGPQPGWNRGLPTRAMGRVLRIRSQSGVMVERSLQKKTLFDFLFFVLFEEGIFLSVVFNRRTTRTRRQHADNTARQ